MQPARQDLPVVPGATYRDTIRIMQPVFVYRDITGIVGAPVVLQVPDHGLASDWPVWVRGAVGMPDLNREPFKQLPHRARRLSADSLEVNSQSAVGLRPSGGQLVYRPPVDLTDATAVLTIFSGADALFVLGEGAGLEVTAPGTIARTLTAAQTLLLAPGGMTYTFDLLFPGGVVTRYFTGAFT
ncbi:hypothetical protein [Pseudomonas baltica]|uniref:Uncharacterized protein n=1 Tax=Pseudomonas baltica TaxID=2762576 RepID=A0A7X1KS06_9PSED|nr:hypothetical protein [Pseudomonas baltica]MBC2676922.1 hypothetical protein [Pseudomonas baltica]